MRQNQKKPDAIRNLRKRLGSSSSDVRHQAYLDARYMSAEQLWAIATVPAEEEKHSSRIATMSSILAVAWAASALWATSSTSFFTPFIVSSILLASGLSPFIASRLVSQHRLYISLSRLLEHQEDAQFVGPALLIYAEVIERDVQASARRTLLRLLPLLDDIHIREWTGAHKAALLDFARHSWGDLELKFFALDALGKVGEANSIPVVRKLAAAQTSRIAERLYAVHIGRETTFRELEREQQREQAIKNGGVMHEASSVSPASSFDDLDADRRETYMAAALYLKRKAEHSLNSILARQQQQQQTTVLLRAAEQPDRTQAQGLLRPADDAGANTPNEQLLKPK